MSIFERLRGKPGGIEDKSSKSERGWTDREITKVEDDRFDFRDYAEVLADRARNAEPPLTIGLYGSWGSGKTSLMRLIWEDLRLGVRAYQIRIIEQLPEWSGRPELLKSIDKSPEARINSSLIRTFKYLFGIEGELQEIESIWINVWQLSNQEEVWQAFLQALFNRVNRKFPWWRRIQWRKLGRELLVNSYRIVVVITPIILGTLIGVPDATWDNVFSLLSFNLSASTNQIAVAAGALTTYALGIWLLVKPAFEAGREVVNIDIKSSIKYGSYEKQITELMKLQDDFAGMVDDLVGEEGRLVVFIDDLDRVTPDKIPDLLEAIKLFTTTPKCVYVLGLDHEIVRQGIFKKYKFEEEREAVEYLEKIVQVPFHLPPLDEGKIEDFVQEYYPKINERCPTAAEVFSKGLEPNPRKVKRAINIYRTVLELADKRVRVWEMDPIDDELAAKIVVILSRYRKLHEYLALHPEFLIDLESLILEDGDIEIDEIKAKIREGETGEILLGSAEEPGLIDAADLHGLVAMLLTEERHYSDEDQKDQINSYIYLIATAEGSATGIRPNRKERNNLLGGESVKIHAQVEEIQQREKEAAYIERLEGALVDHSRYSPAEVASANEALDLLEDWGREDFEPDTIRVPAGPFLMGSTEEQTQKAIDEGLSEEIAAREKPQHQVELSPYRIGIYPVTNREYRAFIKDKNHKPPKDWSDEGYPPEKGGHPVVNVSWKDAQAYCHWLVEKTGRDYRLPTEAEWEKAARGAEGRVYPWGDEWDQYRCNSEENGIYDTMPVSKFSPQGDSPYGAADMAGNIWEWVADWFGRYDLYVGGSAKNPHGPQEGETRVLRGGAFGSDPQSVRCACRVGRRPGGRRGNIGFRVVIPSFIPDWQRQEISEWEQPSPEYIPVKLDNKLVNSENYPDIKLPFSKPLFGRDMVPFELNLEEKQGALKGIEQSYSLETTDPVRSAQIKPGARNIVSAYVLVTAGNAHRVIDDIKFEARKIGYLEFHFDEGDPYRLDLELGKNIREWSYKRPDVIQTLTDFKVQQVWRDPGNEATFDMLRIDFPDPPRNVIHCRLVMDIEDLPGSYKGSLPSLRLSGLTYQHDLKTLLRYDREKISARISDIKEWGEVKDYTRRLEAVIIDYQNHTSEEIASANLALDLLESWQREGFEPETVRVPAGSFLMGSSDDDGLADETEKPQHNVELSDYRIGKYPVTNRQYQAFVQESGHQPPAGWSGEGYPPEKGDHPVVSVFWEDARDYCEWLSDKTGRDYRLPSEAEREKAARGMEGRIYPWGDEWDGSRCNSEESGIGDTTPVGQFSPLGDSPYGAADMAGNVWEWCADWFDAGEYQRRAGGQVVDPKGPQEGEFRVQRGGAFYDLPPYLRCAYRFNDSPDFRSYVIGFRVVVSPPDSDL